MFVEGNPVKTTNDCYMTWYGLPCAVQLECTYTTMNIACLPTAKSEESRLPPFYSPFALSVARKACCGLV